MKIKISINSGANIFSKNEDIVDINILGFDTIEEWNLATDQEKLDAVKDFFECQGYPEYLWEEE